MYVLRLNKYVYKGMKFERAWIIDSPRFLNVQSNRNSKMMYNFRLLNAY